MNSNDDVYWTVFFHDSSPCENLGFNEELNCKEAMGRNASPFAARDPILHYVKTLEEGNSWAIWFDFHIVGHNTLFNFASPPTRFTTVVITRA